MPRSTLRHISRSRDTKENTKWNQVSNELHQLKHASNSVLRNKPEALNVEFLYI